MYVFVFWLFYLFIYFEFLWFRCPRLQLKISSSLCATVPHFWFLRDHFGLDCVWSPDSDCGAFQTCYAGSTKLHDKKVGVETTSIWTPLCL